MPAGGLERRLVTSLRGDAQVLMQLESRSVPTCERDFLKTRYAEGVRYSSPG